MKFIRSVTILHSMKHFNIKIYQTYVFVGLYKARLQIKLIFLTYPTQRGINSQKKKKVLLEITTSTQKTHLAKTRYLHPNL